MNILLVAGPGISLKEPYNSGIEAFIVSLANELADGGHKVSIIAAAAEDHAKFSLVNPFTGSVTDKPGYFRRWLEKRQFKKLAVDAYDVVHYNMFYPHLLEAGLHFQKPSFLTLHSPADSKRITAYKALSRKSDIQFVAISQRVKEEWETALNNKITLIHNGIKPEVWPTTISKGSKYLLWSARINREKNPAAAIQLAKQMNIPLRMAGRIADQHYFDAEVKPHLNSQIEYVGHITQKELSGLARHALAYLATATWQEPFGLAALEMLACGVPVVGFTTAVPLTWKHASVMTTASLQWQDLAELVEKSRTVSPETCAAFAATMSVQTMTAEYVKLYESVIQQKRVDGNTSFVEDHMLPIVSHQPQSAV